MGCYPGLFVASTDNLWIWAGIGFIGGLVLFYRGFRLLQRKRLILNTPTSKIRSASLGLVEVNGLAVGPYTIPAPVTARPCFYYRTRAWEYRQAGKKKEWRLVADENLHVPFYLDDNTGQLLIDPQGADMDIHRDFYEEYGNSLFYGKEMPPNVRAFLVRHGATGDHKVRVEERCIKPKNALYILGTLAENTGEQVAPNPIPAVLSSSATLKINLPSGLAGKMEAALEHLPGATVTRTMTVTTRYNSGPVHQEVINLSPGTQPQSSSEMTQQGKIAAALLKAGITNPAAWETAGVANSRTALTLPAGNRAAQNLGLSPQVSTSHTEDYDLQPKVVLKKGENNPVFLISWRSERDVVKAMGWKSAACIWGGPLLMLLSVYVLLAHFGML
jgi:E3 ubiquitin ligase